MERLLYTRHLWVIFFCPWSHTWRNVPSPLVGEGQGEGLKEVYINLKETAIELRKNSTDAERLLWRHLKARQLDGLKFRRQEQIGRFIADFVCYEKNIVVEADGGQHAYEKTKDEERTQWLNSQGFSVLRFWNNEILTNIEGVMESIRQHCQSPLPSPLPPGARE